LLQLSSDYLYSVWVRFGTLHEDFYTQAHNMVHLEETSFGVFLENIADTFSVLFKGCVLLLVTDYVISALL